MGDFSWYPSVFDYSSVSICFLTTSQLPPFLKTSIPNLFLDNYSPSRCSLTSHKPPPIPRQLLHLYWQLVSNLRLLDTFLASNSSLSTTPTPLNPLQLLDSSLTTSQPSPIAWLFTSLRLLLDFSPPSTLFPIPHSPQIPWLLHSLHLFLGCSPASSYSFSTLRPPTYTMTIPQLQPTVFIDFCSAFTHSMLLLYYSLGSTYSMNILLQCSLSRHLFLITPQRPPIWQYCTSIPLPHISLHIRVKRIWLFIEN